MVSLEITDLLQKTSHTSSSKSKKMHRTSMLGGHLPTHLWRWRPAQEPSLWNRFHPLILIPLRHHLCLVLIAGNLPQYRDLVVSEGQSRLHKLLGRESADLDEDQARFSDPVGYPSLVPLIAKNSCRIRIRMGYCRNRRRH